MMIIKWISSKQKHNMNGPHCEWVALVKGAKYIQIIGRSLIEKVPINSWILFLKLLLFRRPAFNINRNMYGR